MSAQQWINEANATVKKQLQSLDRETLRRCIAYAQDVYSMDFSGLLKFLREDDENAAEAQFVEEHAGSIVWIADHMTELVAAGIAA